jgi:hypothetical protein
MKCLYLLPLSLCQCGGLGGSSGTVTVIGDAEAVQLRKQTRVLNDQEKF